MGILGREIRRTGFDVNGQYGGHGDWALSGVETSEDKRRGFRGTGAGSGVLHFAEAGVGGGPGAIVFVLHHAAALHLIHGGPVYRGTVRHGNAHAAERPDVAGAAGSVSLAFVSVAKL